MAKYKVEYNPGDDTVVKTLTFMGKDYAEVWKENNTRREGNLEEQVKNDFPKISSAGFEAVHWITLFDDDTVLDALHELIECELEHVEHMKLNSRAIPMVLFSGAHSRNGVEFKNATVEMSEGAFRDFKCDTIFEIRWKDNEFYIYRTRNSERPLFSTQVCDSITDYSKAVCRVKELALEVVDGHRNLMACCYYDGYAFGSFSSR